jgi:hypothetical protein
MVKAGKQAVSHFYFRLSAHMFDKAVPSYVHEFINGLNAALEEHKPGSSLTRTQTLWLGICLMGIVVTNSICWARFERASFGSYSQAALSWIFRNSKIMWHMLLQSSVRIILKRYNITNGVLVLDDTDRQRSKQTSKIYLAHKLKDKKSGGCVNGQCIVFLVLITPTVTIPIDAAFYLPDPKLSAWNKEDKRLRRQKIPKAERPQAPPRDKKCPTKQQIALQLIAKFKSNFPEISIKAVVADALYGDSNFVDNAHELVKTQIVSQLRKNQNITYIGKSMSLDDYFNQRNRGVEQKIAIRGKKEVTAFISSARLYVNAHKKKRFVIAIKYSNEANYRYIVASNLAWRTRDIVNAYSLRWLIEVFIEDWKLYEGWGQLAKQPGVDGSSRSLILSLLYDHCLLFHPQQAALLDNKLPACTVGSLRERLRVESIVECFRTVLASSSPQKALEQMRASIEEFFPLRSSSKHLNPVELGRLESTASLRYRAELAVA